MKVKYLRIVSVSQNIRISAVNRLKNLNCVFLIIAQLWGEKPRPWQHWFTVPFLHMSIHISRALSLSLSDTLTLSRTLSLSLSLSLSHCLSLSSLSHILSLSLSLSLSQTHALSLHVRFTFAYPGAS